MFFEASWLRVIVLLSTAFGFIRLSAGQTRTPAASTHPVTVADAISMIRIAGSKYPAVRPKRGFAVFSPDGKRFAIVLCKGNIDNNTNEYSLLVFRAAEVPNASRPMVLTVFSSSSNRVGISDLRWFDDDTILFLGARGAETTQLYSVRCSSRKVKQLTNHPTAVTSYDVSEKLDTIIFAAEEPERELVSDKVLQTGMHVDKEMVTDLIRGRTNGDGFEELFVKKSPPATEQRLHTLGPFRRTFITPLRLSPDGRYLVVETHAMDVPQNWSNYQDSQVEIAFRRGFRGGVDTGILHRELLDTQMDKSEVLLNVPSTSSSSDVLWSPDSKSFLLCPTYLPLNVEDPIEFQLRRSSKFVVEIELPNRTVVKITNQDLTPVRWDLQTNVVEFHLRQKWDETQSVPESIHYRKTGKTWQRLAAAPKEVTDLPANILADQDLNMPPRIVVMDRETKQKTTLLDLNPQFAELAFGKVEEINWKDGTGNTVSGGLYFPPQYIPGKRYPLVIQTHGFEPGTFVIDGSHMTASAAQPLAGREIMVLQVKDIFYDSLDTPREAERVMSAYENAVEYLDQKGIVDRSHVGLAGFSRTCLYVKYTLTHSNQHFAAAIVADGVDAGYFRYLMYYNADPSEAAEYDSVIGAPPFGHGLSLWLKNSPGFLLDKVQTPLQIQAFSANSILGEWQWFEGLKRLGKPVDMLYLPAAAHILVKPWDRIASQGGTLDWFCFWLKGEEDPDPAKAEQYIRWRELRKLQEQNAQQPLQANPPSVH